MRVPIVVPEIGSGEEQLHISGWLADEGDLVLSGDIIAEVLIPGVVFEIAAESNGRLVEIKCPVDDKVAVGDILGWLDDEPSDISESIPKATP